MVLLILLAEGCGCLADRRGRFTVLIAVNAVPSRSSRYICGFLRFYAGEGTLNCGRENSGVENAGVDSRVIATDELSR